MDINETYKNSGLGKWFDEKWVDISRKDKSGKHPPCGASSKKGSRKGDQKKAYPKCRPAKKAAAMSPKLKEKATDQKRRAEKKNPHHKGRKPVMVSHENLSEGKNLPNNPKLWAQSKAKAKSKFDVYPCLPVSYPALTKDGWKYVNELKVGDEIAAFDLNERTSKFVKIENIHIHKNAPVHEIYTDGHYFCTSTLDHKWVIEQNDQLLLESTMGFQSYTKLFVNEGMPLLSNFEIHPSGNEMVWCPETSLGTWVTSINDQPCVTGNSSDDNNIEKDLSEASKNKPNNPKLWSRAQAVAREKFDVHPSAYCVPLYSEALTKNGWKKHDEINIKEEILAYDSESDTLKWTEIEDIHYYEKAKTIKMKKLSFDITCTPNHKWMYFRDSFEKEMDLEKINKYFSLIQDIKLGNKKISHIKKDKKSIQHWYKKYKDCNYEEFLQNVRKKSGKHLVETQDLSMHGNLLISAKLDEQYRSNRPLLESKYKQNWVTTILNMSIEQLESFFMASIIYDGWNAKEGAYGFSQKNKDHGEAFELAAFLTGHRVSRVGKKRSDGVQAWSVLDKRYLPLDGIKIIEDETQDVWCPQTKYSTWIMRQKGRVMITGNSNAFASKWYKQHGGTWRKSKKKYMLKEYDMPSFSEWLENRENGDISRE